MIKRISACILCAMIGFSAFALADEVTEKSNFEPGQEMAVEGENGETGNADGMNTEKPMLQPPEGMGDENANTQPEGQGQNGQMPQMPGGQPSGGGMEFPGQNRTMAETEKGALDIIKEYSTPIISVILLGLAFVFVIFYKRKRY